MYLSLRLWRQVIPGGSLKRLLYVRQGVEVLPLIFGGGQGDKMNLRTFPNQHGGNRADICACFCKASQTNVNRNPVFPLTSNATVY